MNTAAADTLQVACPSCLTPNRVPAARAGDAPKCGRCGAPVLAPAPAVLDDDRFDAFVARTALPVLVDFWAPWCAPCRAMAPAFEQVAREYATRVRFAKLDTDAAQQTAARMGIRSIPTLVLFEGGRETERVSGAMDAGRLRRRIEQHL